MLTSLTSSSHEQGESSHPNHNHNHHHNHQHLLLHHHLPYTHQLLLTCADLIHRNDLSAARRAVSLLSAASSPSGDSTDRLAYQFASALSLRLGHQPTLPVSGDNAGVSQSSCLSLNQVTPFLRFAHLTANQAILEAIDGHRSVHILDFDTAHGLQWPPLLQAIASLSEPPSIRITSAGPDLAILRQTGDRLQLFANSLGLHFKFHSFYLPNNNNNNNISLIPSSLRLLPGETLVVNCILFLHKLLNGGQELVTLFLRAVKAMSPAVMTVAEVEASHSSPNFLWRFGEALDYYAAVFESLEATLPPRSRERWEVESGWFGREIGEVVASDGDERRRRHQRFERWEAAMRGGGFRRGEPSEFSLSQARLLLRLHYPSEGYRLEMARGAIFLGWQDRSLFSVSSWQ